MAGREDEVICGGKEKNKKPVTGSTGDDASALPPRCGLLSSGSSELVVSSPSARSAWYEHELGAKYYDIVPMADMHNSGLMAY